MPDMSQMMGGSAPSGGLMDMFGGGGGIMGGMGGNGIAATIITGVAPAQAPPAAPSVTVQEVRDVTVEDRKPRRRAEPPTIVLDGREEREGQHDIDDIEDDEDNRDDEDDEYDEEQ